ncbi:hypothetical protein AB9E13_35200, partial [Rhizobium leguminosarum]
GMTISAISAVSVMNCSCTATNRSSRAKPRMTRRCSGAMFVEHEDIYRAGGQNHILLGPKLVEPPPTVRTNLFVIEELAK